MVNSNGVKMLSVEAETLAGVQDDGKIFVSLISVYGDILEGDAMLSVDLSPSIVLV